MWFKLASANFSNNNLGKMSTLSTTWSITKRLSGFTETTSTGTSVEKGAAYYATFILNSGETYKSHSVTMNGSAVTSGVSYSNGTLTVNISAVIGPVVIEAFATGSSTGGTTVLTLANYPTTEGIASSGNGKWTTSASALERRTAFVPVDGYSQIKLTHDTTTYKYNLVFYDYNYTNSSEIRGSTNAVAYISDLGVWQKTSPFTYSLPTGTKSIAIGVSTASETTENTASTLADEFTSINLIDAQGNQTALTLSDYNTYTGICMSGAGGWEGSNASAKLKRTAFVNVEGYAQVEFIFDTNAYKFNVVSFSENITQPSDIETTIPASENCYISDLRTWVQTSPFTTEIPTDAKCVLIGVARVDNAKNTASTLADEFISIELL